MNKSTFLVPAVVLPLLFSGCVGVGPNTQQGAVNGGALGAIAGAVIGHNSRGGDTLGGAILGGTLGAIAGGTIGNSVDNQRGTLYDYPPGAGYRTYRYGRVIESSPPPPPASAEAVSAPPAPNALWVPGYWSFDGARYIWITGQWEIPPPNAGAFIVAHWEGRGDGYVYVPGYWR